MSITKRRLADGSTVYDVREYVGFTLDGSRDRRFVSCQTLKAAKIEQAKLIAERDASRNRSGRMNFESYVANYYWPRRKSLAASTKDGYYRDIHLRLIPAF